MRHDEVKQISGFLLLFINMIFINCTFYYTSNRAMKRLNHNSLLTRVVVIEKWRQCVICSRQSPVPCTVPGVCKGLWIAKYCRCRSSDR